MHLHKDDRSEGRQIMFVIVDAFVQRFHTLNRSYEHIMKSHKRFTEKEEAARDELNQKYTIDIEVSHEKALTTVLMEGSESTTSGKTNTSVNPEQPNKEPEDSKDSLKIELVDPSELDLLDLFNDKPIQIHNVPNIDELKDARNLFKNLMVF